MRVSEPKKEGAKWVVVITCDTRKDAQAMIEDLTSRHPPGKRGGNWYQ